MTELRQNISLKDSHDLWNIQVAFCLIAVRVLGWGVMHDDCRVVSVVRLGVSGSLVQSRALIQENVVCLQLGEGPTVELLATPGQERELGAGFAVTMGYLDRRQPAPIVRVDPVTRLVRVAGAVPATACPGPRASSGGDLGPGLAQPVGGGFVLELETVLSFPEMMAARQTLFRATGASHAAALFDRSGGLVSFAEDVGRHNALDKAVGQAWLADRLSPACAVALSGRVSLEMVLKAARAGLAVVVGVSAPTAQATARAQQLGLTLLGFARRRGSHALYLPLPSRLSRTSGAAERRNPGPRWSCPRRPRGTMIEVLLHLTYGFVRASLSIPFRLGRGRARWLKDLAGEGFLPLSPQRRKHGPAFERCLACGWCDLAAGTDGWLQQLAVTFFRSPETWSGLGPELSQLTEASVQAATEICPAGVPIDIMVDELRQRARSAPSVVRPRHGERDKPVIS